MAAGAIIGKGGETIADVQKQTGGKIKMSKSNDFYPGEDLCISSLHSIVVDEVVYSFTSSTMYCSGRFNFVPKLFGDSLSKSEKLIKKDKIVRVAGFDYSWHLCLSGIFFVA